MQNILCTGTSGFLGTILKEELLKTARNVTDITDWAKCCVDISKPFEIGNVKGNVNVVLHIAGKAHSIPKTPEEEKAFFNVNYEGTVNLCNAIEKLPNPPRALIFISTVSVYGLDSGDMIKESHPLNGTSPYAKSKIMAEEFLRDWGKENGITIGIVRLPLIAGPNPPGNLGAMINGIKTGRYLSIGKADAKKSVVWASDIVSVFERLAEIGGTYNLTDRYNPSFSELETEISKALNKSKPMKIPLGVAKIIAGAGDLLGSRAPINSDKLKKITSTLTFDDRKAVEALGWNPTYVLDKMKHTV